MNIIAAIELAQHLAKAGLTLAQQFKEGAALLNETDQAKAKEALADLQKSNDALYAAVQAQLAAASQR